MKKRNFFAVVALALCSMLILTACVKEPVESKPTDNSNSHNSSESSDILTDSDSLAGSSSEQEVKLSESTDGKLIDFLTSSGVYDTSDINVDNLAAAREYIAELEEDPEHSVPGLSNPRPIETYEKLRVALKMYYDRPALPENTILSEMPDDECRQFLKSVLVNIPIGYSMETIKKLIANYEKDRNYTYNRTPGYGDKERLFNQLRVVVIMYYQ